ncbi:MAG: RNA ligase family protein [Acidobacteria bacterium]|nr:RNA ligase family protein [Acidobacteriota bacterium]
MDQVPQRHLLNQFVVVEEKVDGANAAISFDELGQLQLQSRGHFLTGGQREKHFNLFKTWAMQHRSTLFDLLGKSLVLYGEWMYAKHTIFYDALPHYFLEFDILDRSTGEFWSTVKRQSHLKGSPIHSVPVLWQGTWQIQHQPENWLRKSLYQTGDWWQRLHQQSQNQGLDPQRIARETDPNPLAEGLYLKIEEGEKVIGRLKWIRASFLTQVVESGSHWLNRPIIPNQLQDKDVLFK